VPLNTVRDLMGHADIKMTLRYAHLAPDQRKQAVELLVKGSSSAASTALARAGTPFDYAVWFERTAQHYGGHRLW
jgi:hypothetical protein